MRACACVCVCACVCALWCFLFNAHARVGSLPSHTPAMMRSRLCVICMHSGTLIYKPNSVTKPITQYSAVYFSSIFPIEMNENASNQTTPKWWHFVSDQYLFIF